MSKQVVRKKFSEDDILDVLREFWDIADWEVRGAEGEINISANSERPAIYWNRVNNKLSIEYPDENEELPNPNNGNNYPETAEEYKEYLGEEIYKKIESECKGDRDCIIERGDEYAREKLKKELEDEIKKIRKQEPRHYTLCGVPVLRKTDIYEETRYDNYGTRYTAYIPSDLYIVDLDKVPDKETLGCVIDKINQIW